MVITTQRVPVAGRPICPICGALREHGGCRDPKLCADALIRKEEDARSTSTFLHRDASLLSTRLLEAGFDALSLLCVGLIVCSATGQVLGCNPPAQAVLTAREGLEQESDGTLTCTEPAVTPLAEIVQEISKQNHSGRSNNGVILAVRRAAPRRPLTVLLRACSMPPGELVAAVLVIILDSALRVKAIDSDLRQLYGFTSTEARLANLLMEGKALETCCDRMGICRSTGCTHLRRLFKRPAPIVRANW